VIVVLSIDWMLLTAAIDPEVAIAAVNAWSNRKRKLFKPNHLRKAWQRLDEQNWLVAADF
jgi:hypothetical protein